ncbi:potassium channel subfamily T member 2-like protein [Leptotrombidium deliense]|uniref:Potassium channel subfamily T member 2-like protein n=1 Tax=Leptotrombidium deliense TaxID=299467 RepID=A0A443S661_9ACAR|nr:potassium channel subfamily T member 2-like protein [Leptotrombidium deliense]
MGYSYRRYGVALIGIQTDMRGTWPIMLNPGPTYVLKSSDICFYLNIAKEENSSFLSTANQPSAELSTTVIAPEPKTAETSECKPSSVTSGEQLLKVQEVDIIRKLSSISSHSTAMVSDGNSSKKNSIIDMLSMSGQRRKSSSIFGSLMDFDDQNSNNDSSSTRIKRAVSDFASKTKRAITKRSSNQLEIPKVEFGATNDVVAARGRRPSIAAVPVMFVNIKVLRCYRGYYFVIRIVKGFPPCSPYVGVSPTLCYLLREKKPCCCLQLSASCDHNTFTSIKDYNWSNKCIILATDFASNGIYNFIVPQRAYFHSPQSLRPIVLLLEQLPHPAFIDAISWFPMVYWMQGSLDNLDDLIRSGINTADAVVVVNKESSNSAEEDYLADCNTIVAVQTMFKMFPGVRIITELSQSSNMRFMQFRAHDVYALSLSKMEKLEKERGSHISYMFRLPFAAGSVFSASMLDTLLYQAFVKDYVITIIRLLLGIDQAPGSGFLSSMRITKDDLWIRTYGRLYQKLCSTTCEIPIGVFRTQSTQNQNDNTINLDFIFPVINEKLRYQQLVEEIERQEIINLVKNRMQDLGFCEGDYENPAAKRNSISYVIINPNFDLSLEEGDIIYLIRPSPIKSKKTFISRGNSIRPSNWSSKRRQSQASNTSQSTQPRVSSKSETSFERKSSSASINFTTSVDSCGTTELQIPVPIRCQSVVTLMKH